jgi:peptidoglycan/LPS O-acetylase OafA/YrhL
MKYFDSIDLYRAIGVCFVFLYHSVYLFGSIIDGVIGPHIYFITALMWSGVNLFFLASGFINGKQFINTKSTSLFLISRAKRIFPLYYLYLTIGTCLFMYGNTFFYIDNYNLIYQYLFLSGVDFFNENLGHPAYFCITWSLSVEIQLYLITFFIIKFANKSTIRICLGLSLIGLFTPYLHANHFGLIMHLDEYFVGVLLRTLYNTGILQSLIIKWICITGLFISALILPNIELTQGNPLLDSVLLLIYSSILILLLNFKFNIHKSLLEIGKNCYFIYLFHMLFIYMFLKFLNNNGINPIISLCIAFVFCYFFSIISKIFFESIFYRKLNDHPSEQ